MAGGSGKWLNRSELKITNTLLKAIAKAARIGFNRPQAASPMPMIL
jgi:hypothetical protein